MHKTLFISAILFLFILFAGCATTMSEQVRVSHILIRAADFEPDVAETPNAQNEAKAAAVAKAEELLEQIRNGADFEALAREHSSCPSAAKGGDLGFFPRGRMVSNFEKVAFDLKVGEISDVVETIYGYHIIKVTDRKYREIYPQSMSYQPPIYIPPIYNPPSFPDVPLPPYNPPPPPQLPPIYIPPPPGVYIPN